MGKLSAKILQRRLQKVVMPDSTKGDLTQCHNWHGITLLDVVGILQRRLQKVVMPDSECGFRSGRGYIDMIFCARQLVEKSREHNTKTYMLS